MSIRTVKGSAFAILVDGKRIVVTHVFGKGKRCRVTAPPGVRIEPLLVKSSAPRPPQAEINSSQCDIGEEQ